MLERSAPEATRERALLVSSVFLATLLSSVLSLDEDAGLPWDGVLDVVELRFPILNLRGA